MPEITRGYCHCGCGRKTNTAPYNDSSRGWVVGEPFAYVHGHAMRGRKIGRTGKPYVVDENGCWVWQRNVVWSGYGMAWEGGKHKLAHRMFYEQAGNTIPAEYQLDHACGNRRCVNPEHLEPVTRRVNVRRGANTRLEQEDVDAIRWAWGQRKHDTTRKEFSRSVGTVLGVSDYCVQDVVSGRTWNDAGVPT